MSEQFGTVLVGTAGLSVALLIAAWLTLARPVVALCAPADCRWFGSGRSGMPIRSLRRRTGDRISSAVSGAPRPGALVDRVFRIVQYVLDRDLELQLLGCDSWLAGGAISAVVLGCSRSRERRRASAAVSACGRLFPWAIHVPGGGSGGVSPGSSARARHWCWSASTTRSSMAVPVSADSSLEEQTSAEYQASAAELGCQRGLCPRAFGREVVGRARQRRLRLIEICGRRPYNPAHILE
jgi:hypothetical protein